MAMRTESFKIKSNDKVENVSITTFSAFKGLNFGRRILHLISPILKTLDSGDKKVDITTLKNQLSKSKINMDKLVDALMSSTEDSKLENLIFELVQTTSVGKHDLCEKEKFDNIFADNYGFLFEILKKIFEMNLSSFFKKKSTGEIPEIEEIS